MSSKIKSLDTPNIIKSKNTYYYEEGNQNNPKFILILENRNIDTNNISSNPITNLSTGINIDYNDKNPNSPNNIFNYFNKKHGEIIDEYMKDYGYLWASNGFYSANSNFAYHFFIDKMGNIYEGRPFNVKAFNLDALNSDGSIVAPNSLIFGDSIIILTEEDTTEKDTTDATYTALKSLLRNLLDDYDFKNFYGYSELNRYDHSGVSDPEEDAIRFNNPGIFFKINELHFSVEFTEIEKYRNPINNIKIYTYGKRSLQYFSNNMVGNDISMLQKMLYNLEIIKDYREVNGRYTLITKQAVEKFQKINYITPTERYGIADSNTLLQLRDIIYKNKIKNIQIFDENYILFRTLEYKEDNPMVGIDVQNIQKLLKKKIKFTLNVNGIYDKDTENAVKLFQMLTFNGSSKNADGKVGPVTLKFLRESNLLCPSSDGLIKPNENLSNNESIVLLQKALNNFLKKYRAKVPENGYYGKETYKYIEEINKKESNRKILGIDKYGGDPTKSTEDKNKYDLYWSQLNNLRTCYPEEYDWIIEHYLLNEKINLII